MLREDALDLERGLGEGEVEAEVCVLDAEGAETALRTARIPVVDATAGVGAGLAEAAGSVTTGRIAAGREPATGLPFVAVLDDGGEWLVCDFLTRNEDLDLRAFPEVEGAGAWLDDLVLEPTKGAQGSSGSDAEWTPNPVPKVLLHWLLKYEGGRVLDCGAGDSSLRAPHLVNLEVFGFPNTDVVASGQQMPFADGTFDAVLSAAVLEHVPDPFAYGRELLRVVKPGGEIRVDAAFLQPYHACPDHYFGATISGLREAVPGTAEAALGVGPHQSPFVALQTMLGAYAAAMPEGESRDAFYGRTVAELLEAPPGLGPVDLRVSPEAAHTLASGVYLHGVKPA